MNRDADRMMRECGMQAYETAGEMSWREDAGLMASDSPGHWHRVQEEIGRRTNGATVPLRGSALLDAQESFARFQ